MSTFPHPKPLKVVFFSDLLSQKCPVLFRSITDTLKEHNIAYGILDNTKDIWCRDYMPIQTEDGRLIYYLYNPDYLQTPYYRRTITDINSIESLKGISGKSIHPLDLVIDGGNVVVCGDKVVMTEKVFAENNDKSPEEVGSYSKRLSNAT